MKAFRVRGTFLMGRNRHPFTKEVTAENQEVAVERVLSDLGSRHRTKRRDIAVKEVAELSADEVTDTVVADQVGGG